MDPLLPPPPSDGSPTAVPFAYSPPQPASPQSQQQPSSDEHPSYTKMITDALRSVKDKNGLSERGIANYIDNHFQNLGSNHLDLLGAQLKILKDSGVVTVVKNCYKLSDDIGRSGGLSSSGNDGASGSKRPRGRPPKVKAESGGAAAAAQAAAQPMFVALGLADESDEPDKKRGRGKTHEGEVGSVRSSVGVGASASQEKKRRGRPPKDKSVVKEIPKSIESGGSGRGRGRGRGRGSWRGRGSGSGSGSGSVSGRGSGRGRGRGHTPSKKMQVNPVMIPFAPEYVAPVDDSVNVADDDANVPDAGVLATTVPLTIVNVGNNGGAGSGVDSAPVVGLLTGVPKGRGRPRKNTAGTCAGVNTPTSAAGRGRVGAGTGSGAGVGVNTEVSTVVGVGFRAGVGAGSGSGVGTNLVLPKRRGRPPKAAQAAVTPVKKRGRPPMDNGASMATHNKHEKIQMDNGATVASEKRRGRPPGVARVEKQGISAGKHVRQNASTAAESSQAGDRDLMQKLDYFQSKIKEAVVKLRPHISSQPSSEAVAAMQELEGLAALDVSAPFVGASQQALAARD